MTMLEIDGSHGEGGGQILRSSLALSLATGTPFRITKIRNGRAKPGLLRQHLTAVEATRTVGVAEVEGAALGSKALSFVPGTVAAGAYHFAIGSAGSTLLVVQALLPALLVSEGTFHITVEGGTHNPSAPTFDYFARVLAPILRRLGAQLEIVLDRPGFYPAGGGRIRLNVTGLGGRGRLAPLELCERGEVRSRLVTALISALPRHVAEREIAAACDHLRWDPSAAGLIEAARSPGPGNTLSVEIGAEHVTELFASIGEKGLPAEKVALAAATEARAWLDAGVPVGEHLADQLLVPLALGSGGRFRTVRPTLHTTTQIDLLRQFIGVEVRATELDDGVWELEVPGWRRLAAWKATPGSTTS
jgi:RNA 3'-terminal phosphate cyclase (ATP)